MIDKLTAFTLDLLKTNVSIVLIFYVSGFLSFIAYYRVLGLSYIAGSSQVYAELAGKNLLIILQTFIFLVTQPDHFIKNINALNWVGNIIYIWLAAVLILAIIYTIFKLFPQKQIIINIRHNPYTTGVQLGLITIAVLTTFHIETQSFQAENVLQANNLTKFYEEWQLNTLNDEQQFKKIDYQQRMEIFNKSSEANAIKNFFFSIPEKYDESGNDDKRLNALMLIILIASITAIILAIHRQHNFIKWLMFFFAFAQAILIPFNYGILGTKYQYPVISLDYTTEKDKVSHKEGVFLLAKSQESLVIYDRLSFFQISYIPKSTVIHLEQVFTSSPFSNCSNGDFKPCELYATKQSSD